VYGLGRDEWGGEAVNVAAVETRMTSVQRRAIATMAFASVVVTSVVLWLDSSLHSGNLKQLVELTGGVGAGAATALLALALLRLNRMDRHRLTAAMFGSAALLTAAALVHVVADSEHGVHAGTDYPTVSRLLSSAQWAASALLVLGVALLHNRRHRGRVVLTGAVVAAAAAARLAIPIGGEAAHSFLPASLGGTVAGVVIFGAVAFIAQRRSRGDEQDAIDAIGVTLCAGFATISAVGFAATVISGDQSIGHAAELYQLIVVATVVVTIVEQLAARTLVAHREEAAEASAIATASVTEHRALHSEHQDLRHDGYAALTAIQAVAAAARTSTEAGDLERSAELLGVIDDELFRLRRMLRPNLYLGRDFVVADVLERMELMFRSRGLDIRSLADRGVRINGDPDVLARVLANLIQNVIDHAPGASARLLSYRSSDGVTIEVIDDGPGIDTRMRGVVLERGVSTKMTDGSGLGLSAVAELLHVHGASLRLADGDDGRGLRVIISFAHVAAAGPEFAEPDIDLTDGDAVVIPLPLTGSGHGS
jgi:signal transduction histidine kinase